MSFSITNTSASAVITDITTPSSVTGDLSVTSGALPLSVGGFVAGTNTTLENTKGSPYGTFQMFLQQGDALIDTYFNNTLYSSEKYSSGIIEIQTPVVQSGDSLTMSVSDPNFDCYEIGAAFAGGSSEPEIMKVQADGKLIVGGYFTTYQGVSANRIVRLNTDFSIDDTFDYGTGFNDAVNAVAIQSDGKILCGGDFTNYNGVSRNRIIRLNSDGSIDNTFAIGTGFNATVWVIVVQPDDKILVGGDFVRYSGSSFAAGALKPKITRLNSDGSIDSGFADLTVLNNTVYDIALQSNNKIILTGAFTQVSGQTYNRIVRLNTNGTIDSSFVTGGLSSFGYAVAVDEDDKVMVGGSFASVSGFSTPKLVRLLSGGTRDTSFDIGSGFTQNGATATANTLDIIPTQDGKYLVSGFFDNYDGTPVNALVRINSDGSIDTTFNQGTGLVYDENGFSMPSAVLSNGNIVVGGLLSGYDGETTGTLVAVDPLGKLLNCT